MQNYKQQNYKSNMGHQFSQVPHANIERSSFNRSHNVKTTFDAGYLIPFLVDEALPGDTFKVDATLFARLATPIFPLMDNAYLDTQFFAVPIRLLWDNWEKFNGSRDNPTDSVEYTIPQIPVNGLNIDPLVQQLHDYFGIPIKKFQSRSINVNALHHRAYNLIWNEWYRDQNLQESITVLTGDGPDSADTYKLLRRGKRHDYFTSCLPWPQKGDAVQLPTSGTDSVKTVLSNADDTRFKLSDGIASTQYVRANNIDSTSTSRILGQGHFNENVELRVDNIFYKATSTVQTDTGGTINDLRRAFQIQKLLERDARGGTRYTEIVKAHFNVTSPDSRLQRPEYLGGGSAPLIINPVAKTNGPSGGDASPQANLSAIGTIESHQNGFTKSFTEHCVIIGLLSVRADLSYQQGLDRMWSRQTRYDYFWPALAHIGEQAVHQKEIYATGVKADDDKVFGYQERYAEYRYKNSMITGLFRSSAAGSLDSWHLSQNFSAAPTLGPTFIQDNPPFDRAIAVTTEPHFILDSYIKMICARPMPVYGVPGQMDRF